MPPPLDLSRAAKLKHVAFRWERQSVQYIIATLQTAQSKALRQITIALHASADVTLEMTPEWNVLDCLLDRLWISRSVTSKIVCEDNLWERTVELFPKLADRGRSATPDDGRDPSNRKHMDSGQLVYASIREPLVVILYSHTRSTYSATLGGVPGATGGHGSNQPRHHRTISVPTRTPQACRR